MTDSEFYLGGIVTVKVNNPIGSKNPKFGIKYSINYGFVPGTDGGDGEDLGAYILDVKEKIDTFKGTCIGIFRGVDKVDRLVVAPTGTEHTDEEILEQTHFQEKFYRSKLVREIEEEQ